MNDQVSKSYRNSQQATTQYSTVFFSAIHNVCGAPFHEDPYFKEGLTTEGFNKIIGPLPVGDLYRRMT